MRARSRLLLGTAFVALLVAVSALPGSAAPEKVYRLDITPTTAVGGSSTTFAAKFTNTTPGNSSFNSLTVTVPTGFTVTGASITASSTSQATATVSPGTTTTVTGMSPIKRNEFVTVSVTATAPETQGCTPENSSLWGAEVWTGSNTSGNTFRLAASTGTTTQVSVACSIRFVEGRMPSDGVINSNIKAAGGNDVQAEVLKNGTVDLNFGGTVQLVKASGPTATLSGASATASAGVASFPNLQIDTAGTYTLKATSGSLESSASPSFTIFGDGIDCGQEVDFSGEGTSVTLERTDPGPSEGCEVVPYSIVVRGTEIDFIKDEQTLREQGATFRLTITWADPPGEYPDFGFTEFDIDFDGPIPAFIPEFCARADGVAQYPNNPNGEVYWDGPGSDADQPWCVDTVTVNGDQVTETFLGAGDPAIKRK